MDKIELNGTKNRRESGVGRDVSPLLLAVRKSAHILKANVCGKSDSRSPKDAVVALQKRSIEDFSDLLI